MTTHQTNAAPQLNFDSVIRNLIDLIFDETVCKTGYLLQREVWI